VGRYLCPTCSGPTRVIETRLADDRLKRRRACEENHRFNTIEVPIDARGSLKELMDWLGKHIDSDLVEYGKSEVDRILLGIEEPE
jgi:hypothetical protein